MIDAIALVCSPGSNFQEQEQTEAYLDAVDSKAAAIAASGWAPMPVQQFMLIFGVSASSYCTSTLVQMISLQRKSPPGPVTRVFGAKGMGLIRLAVSSCPLSARTAQLIERAIF